MSDAPIEYMKRTKAYYLALGYDNPYTWVHFADVPFANLRKPLEDCRVAITTTAAPFLPGKGDQGPGAAYNAEAKFYEVYEGDTCEMPDLRISHIAIDRDHTRAEDIGTWFPLAALKRAEAQGRIGKVANKFFGLPTNRSQSTTMDVDCARLVELATAAEVDVMVLVPNCPVCHQSVSLAARALEHAGIPTVVMGCAMDIVTHAGVPRFLFSDFPLGNSAGRPGDVESQDETLGLALALLETAREPRAVRTSSLKWPGDGSWKADYSNPAKLSQEEIAQRKARFDAQKRVARTLRDG